MPRQPPKERRNNPIRKLRGILAVPGNKSLSQRDLAPIVDIPLDLLKRVESGRKDFDPLIQNRILCETGASWDERDKCWRFWQQNGQKYTREHWLNYRKLLTEKIEEFVISRADIFFAEMRIRLLLEQLPPIKRFKFLFRLNSFLENSRKEFCPDQFAELFKDATGFIEAYPEIDRDHPMIIRRGYPKRLLEHSPFPYSPPPWIKVGQPSSTPTSAEFTDWLDKAFNPADFDLAGYEKVLTQPQPQAKKQRKKAAAVSSGE
jgi:hypothetical protein